LAKEVLKNRGSLKKDEDFKYKPEDFEMEEKKERQEREF